MENDKMSYQNTKIYKIESHLGDKIYVGSTAKAYLSQRLQQHKYSYQQWKKQRAKKVMVYELFEEYGVDNCEIVLIESYPCNTKDEKNAREAFYIQSMKCVNKNIPGRTSRQYYDDNIEKRKAYGREHSKQYYKDNKETKLEKIICECGSSYTRCNRSHHIRSINHIAYEESNK